MANKSWTGFDDSTPSNNMPNEQKPTDSPSTGGMWRGFGDCTPTTGDITSGSGSGNGGTSTGGSSKGGAY